MTDPRNRWRPQLHSGVAYKIERVIAEVIERDDPALYDWILRAAYPDESFASPYWQWRTDDTSHYEHPSLEPEQTLKLVARGTSELARDLRAAVPRLCIQLGNGRSRTEPLLDVSGCAGMTQVEKLRILGLEPDNVYKWRETIATTTAKPLVGFAAIASMTALAHLTIIGCSGLDASVLARLPNLRFLEIVGGDLADLAPLATTSLETLALVGCKQLRAITALPPTLQRLHVEDCDVGELPATSAQVSYTRGPVLRDTMTRSVFADA